MFIFLKNFYYNKHSVKKLGIFKCFLGVVTLVFFKQVSTRCTNLQIRGWSPLDFLEQVSTGVLTCGGGGPSTFSRKNNLVPIHVIHIPVYPPPDWNYFM